MTGGRLKRVAPYLADAGTFCFTYGDGVADIDITAEIAYHRAEGRLATVAAVVPPGKYGSLHIDAGSVTEFTEKPPGDGNVINGGFFVLEPQVLSYIEDDATIFEVRTARAAGGENVSSPHFGTTASGSPSTRCATSFASNRSGRAAKRRGARGKTPVRRICR